MYTVLFVVCLWFYILFLLIAIWLYDFMIRYLHNHTHSLVKKHDLGPVLLQLFCRHSHIYQNALHTASVSSDMTTSSAKHIVSTSINARIIAIASSFVLSQLILNDDINSSILAHIMQPRVLQGLCFLLNDYNTKNNSMKRSSSHHNKNINKHNNNNNNNNAMIISRENVADAATRMLEGSSFGYAYAGSLDGILLFMQAALTKVCMYVCMYVCMCGSVCLGIWMIFICVFDNPLIALGLYCNICSGVWSMCCVCACVWWWDMIICWYGCFVLYCIYITC